MKESYKEIKYQISPITRAERERGDGNGNNSDLEKAVYLGVDHGDDHQRRHILERDREQRVTRIPPLRSSQFSNCSPLLTSISPAS